MENSAIPTDKPWLFGLTLDELERIAAENGMPRFAARQIASWLYRKGADSIGGMTDLSLKNREKLAGKYELGTIPFADVQRSADGTKKYLSRLCRAASSSRPTSPTATGRRSASRRSRVAGWAAAFA